MEERESRIVGYMVHDPIGNSEGVLQDYSRDLIAQLAESGMLFIAVHEDGSRSLASADDVTEPTPMVNGVTLVQPEYVDTRLKAVADALDAVQALFDVKTLAKLIKGDTDPLKAIKEKADALRALLPEEAE